MIAYNFDPLTREYTGRETAPENPKRLGEYLMPANSTQTPPPEIREGYARIWNGSAWEYAEDHRGHVIWQDHETGRTVDTLGPIPEGWSTERPPEPPAPEPDRTDFDASCATFRAVCAQIGQAIGVPDFRGGFDEMAAFSAHPVSDTLEGVKLAVMWSAANDLCTYEGRKIGLGQPAWWYECWKEA